MEENENIQVVLTGAGMKRENNGLSPLCILSETLSFNDANEFGRFTGNIIQYVNRYNNKEYNIFIPREARRTWNVRTINGGTPDMFVNWSEEFSDSDANTKDLNSMEVLSYWLKLTGHEDIRRALINSLPMDFTT